MAHSLRTICFGLVLTSVTFANEVGEPDLASYESTIAPFIQRYCINCHDELEAKGNLSLEEVDPNLINGDHTEVWRMVEDQIYFNEMPPKNKRQPSKDERDAVLTWLKREFWKSQMPGAIGEEKLVLPQFGNYVDHEFLFGRRLGMVYPAPPRIWRLREAIYDSKAPRLGENIGGLANALGATDGSEFKDYSAQYFLDEAAAIQLLGNAKKIAIAQLGPKSRDRAFKELVSESGPPKPETVSSAINMAFIKALGRKPTAEEVDRFQAFYKRAFETGGYKSAAKALLTAVLMQPEFYYRQELGDGNPDQYGRVRLSQRELAYALSYALTDAPVDNFLKAAAVGELATADQIRALVRDRIKDESLAYAKNPRIMQFFREYFHYPFSNEVFKDPPPGGEHRSGSLVDDLEMTIKDILREDRHVLAELLTTRDYYVNAKYEQKDRNKPPQMVKRDRSTRKYQTAFNLPLDWKWSADRQPVTFRSDERAGVLTHPAWLTAWSGNFENHPVQRGKWIRTHLLGGTVPDVPIGVDARVPEQEGMSFRQRLKQATGASECWRCHKKMDPLGVVFERYDHYGRYQRLDAGQPVDASGIVDRTKFPEINKAVSSPVEMMELLAKSERVEQVFVRYVFRYFMGRNETLGDANTLQDAHKAYRDSGGSFNELVVSILGSDSFVLRQLPRK